MSWRRWRRKPSPTFVPTTAQTQVDELQNLAYLIDEAMVSVVSVLATMPPDAKRAALFDRLMKPLAARAATPRRSCGWRPRPYAGLATQPVADDQVLAARQQLLPTHQRLALLEVRAPRDRAAQREFTRDNLGTISELDVLDLQYELLVPDQTESAIDSELPAIWWGFYSRFRWRFQPALPPL